MNIRIPPDTNIATNQEKQFQKTNVKQTAKKSKLSIQPFPLKGLPPNSKSMMEIRPSVSLALHVRNTLAPYQQMSRYLLAMTLSQVKHSKLLFPPLAVIGKCWRMFLAKLALMESISVHFVK